MLILSKHFMNFTHTHGSNQHIKIFQLRWVKKKTTRYTALPADQQSIYLTLSRT